MERYYCCFNIYFLSTMTLHMIKSRFLCVLTKVFQRAHCRKHSFTTTNLGHSKMINTSISIIIRWQSRKRILLLFNFTSLVKKENPFWVHWQVIPNQLLYEKKCLPNCTHQKSVWLGTNIWYPELVETCPFS